MLIFLFRLLSRLPLPVLHAFGAVLGWIVYLASPSYRRRLKENITRAGYRKQLAATIVESGKNILELPFIWCASPARVLRTANLKTPETLQAALAHPRGVIFLTPHLGCFEILPQVIATHTHLTVLYRPPRKNALKPLVEDARARTNLSLAPTTLAGVRILLKALKKSEPIGLLPDQVPQNGEGVWADFFGKPAYTMTLPAKLHQMSEAPIVLAYAKRLPYGRGYDVYFSPLETQLEGSPEQQAQAINHAMENLIAQCPEQYFWSYHRYKVPAGVVAPSSPHMEKTCDSY